MNISLALVAALAFHIVGYLPGTSAEWLASGVQFISAAASGRRTYLGGHSSKACCDGRCASGAGLLAYVLAELFALPQIYWAVFSAIIIMQASVGGSIKATTDRLIGTIGGAVAGGAVAYLSPHTSVLSLGVALVIALVPLTLVAALWFNYRIAPLTAVIVLLTPGAQQLGPLHSAFHRIVEITLGSFVGLGVSLVLLRARAHGLVIGAAARMLGHLAHLLGDWLAVLAGRGDRTRIGQLQDDIRAEMA